MIDNLELFKPLLEFKKEGDFYYLMVVTRKKDQTTDKANHQSARTIRSYSITSMEYLEEKYDEMKKLAELFKARVYLGVNRLNNEQVVIRMMKELVNRLESGNKNCRSIWDSTVGTLTSQDKRWVVDLDGDEVLHKEEIKKKINSLEPEGEKILAEIPTLNGIHLITKPFRFDHFEQWCQAKHFVISVQKGTNPSILFIPQSLIDMKNDINKTTNINS